MPSSMNESERNIVRCNRTALVKHIINVEDVLDGLFEERLFTSTMNEEILSQKTKSAQVRMLLDYVVRRGPNAFDRFYEVLVRCGDGLAADFLKPERKDLRQKEWDQQCRSSSSSVQIHSQPYKPISKPLPQRWPDDNLIKPANMKLELCSQYMEQLMNSTHVFPMRSDCHGHVVIINNENFEEARKTAQLQLSNRDGTKEDEAAIGDLFHQLGFQVRLHRDLTAKQIKEVLTVEACSDHSKFDCIVVFVLSHGEKDCVFGVDGETVPLSFFLDAFDGERAPTLVDKPKLFFIQACQGKREDGGSVPSQPAEDIAQTLRNLDLNKPDQHRSDAKCERTRPSKAEAFMALATTADYVSWRNTQTGTWFIQALVYVMRDYAATDHLSELMTKVNRLVSNAETSSGMKQISEHRSTLTRDFYFFPGLTKAVNSRWNAEESLSQTAVASPSEEQSGLPPLSHSLSNSSVTSTASHNQTDRQPVGNSSFANQPETVESPTMNDMHATNPKRVDEPMDTDNQAQGPIQCTDNDGKFSFAF